MNDIQVGRVLRALRHRLGWTQREVAARARRPRGAVMDIEAGRVGTLTIDSVRGIAAVLGAEVSVEVRYRGAELDRLMDAGHARFQERWKRRLEGFGWTVWVEVSFNRYGERGRMDLLAWHPHAGVALVIELKTVIADLQSLLGGLDVKARLAPHVLAPLGVRQLVSVVPVLLIADTSTNRRRVRAHLSLFDRYALRGRTGLAWLRAPVPTRAGLLLLISLPKVADGDLRRAGRQRVRRSPRPARSEPASETRVSAS